jgi:ABC-type phosphate transport system substrate-binding protein
MRIPNKQILGTAAVLGMLVTAASARDLEIVANNSVKVAAISEGDVRDVFLGESNSVGGSKVVPVVLAKGGAQEAFLQLLGKTESAFQATWRKQVFTGKGTLPRAFDNEEALVAYVSATPGAIGYVGTGKPVGGVKVLQLK